LKAKQDSNVKNVEKAKLKWCDAQVRSALGDPLLDVTRKMSFQRKRAGPKPTLN
jgi:hypothetical protein